LKLSKWVRFFLRAPRVSSSISMLSRIFSIVSVRLALALPLPRTCACFWCFLGGVRLFLNDFVVSFLGGWVGGADEDCARLDDELEVMRDGKNLLSILEYGFVFVGLFVKGLSLGE